MRFVYISSTSASLLTSSLHRRGTGTREHQRKSRSLKNELSLPAKPITFRSQFLQFSCCDKRIFIHFLNLKLKMASNLSMDSSDSNVIFLEQISNEPSPQRDNSPIIQNSTELLGTHTTEMPTISSVASPEPDIVTIDDESNGPTFPYGFEAQQLIVPPSLNDFNLAPNPFNH